MRPCSRFLSRWLGCLLLIAGCGDSTGPDPVPSDRLAGDPDDPAVAAIVREIYEPRREDFSLGHPDFPGMLLSHRVAILGVAPTANVGTVNALLDRLGAEIAGGIPGVAGQAAGLLALRFPYSTHTEMEATLGILASEPLVQAPTQDIELVPAELPAENGGTPPEWVWDEAGISGAWGMAAIRAPQLWTLNRAIRARNELPVLTGVLDNGFSETHPDLALAQYVGTRQARSHGTHVAGTIGARFDNRTGVDGVTPFAALVVRRAGSVSTLGSTLWGLDELVRAQPGIRVVNASLQYGWHLAVPIVDVRTDLASQVKANTDGALAFLGLAALQLAGYPLPVVAVAAGNHGTVLPGLDAKFGSPLANAGLARGAAPVIVVESDSLVAAGPAFVRSDFSNVNGHLSAPGSLIWSTDTTSAGYSTKSGTSMAAPHVTGLVSFLYALAPDLPAPSLGSNAVRDLLLANLQPGDRYGRPEIDAFAAALDVDRIRGNDAVLRSLLDVDDGTPDGNLRLDAAGAVISADDAATDGARIDMADFRRWRDWLLQIENLPGLALDGAGNHPKKDPNGDGAPGEGALYEGQHPRGDFNGDGKLDRMSTRVIPGVAAGGPRTDLEVLQQLFEDPHYGIAELPALISSGDFHVDASDCFLLDGALNVVTTLAPAAGGPAIGAARGHSSTSPVEILTLPAPAGYRITIEVSDNAGTVIGTAELETDLQLGEDVHLRPDCAGAGGATISLGWGGEPMGGEIRLYSADRSTGGQTCHVLYQPIPVPPVSTASTCQLGGATANGSWTATLSAPPGGPVTISVSGIIEMSQGASTGGEAWESFASSALSAYFTVIGGTARYELDGSVQVSGYQGSDWNLDAWITFNSSQGAITTAIAGGCHRAEGCAPATVPVSSTGILAPGIYSIGGILRAGTGHVTSEPRAGTAQYTYQLVLRP